MLARRMQKVMDLIVSKDQTGYIKNRNLSDNVVLINSVIDYCEKFKKNSYVYICGFWKSFW